MSSFTIELSNEEEERWHNPIEKKSVKFFPQALVTEIPDRTDFTEEERSSLWYSRNEYSSLKGHVRRDVAILELFNEPCPDTDRFTSVGLKTREETEHDAILRKVATRTVLFEQKFQWDEFETNDERLADLYLEYSFQHKRLARDRAADLASEMVQHYNYKRLVLPVRKVQDFHSAHSRRRTPCSEFPIRV